MKTDSLDEIGYWSEIKLDILKKYAAAYTSILSSQKDIKGYGYIDAFAGAGAHVSRDTGELIPGSPVNALTIKPPFTEYHFIDLSSERTSNLKDLVEERGSPNPVYIYTEDCNQVLLEKILPRFRYHNFMRALCLIDPYNISVNWEVLATLGQSKSVEIFFNFMIMDANMNVFKHDQNAVSEGQLERMDKFWGDRSWKNAVYSPQQGLFGTLETKNSNQTVVEAFRQRLIEVAGFKYVPKPLPMRNSKGAVVYYLFFASPNRTGATIVQDIFRKYKTYGVS